MDDEWSQRHSAVTRELIAHRHELVEYGRDLFGAVGLPHGEHLAAWEHLHARYLGLVHRNDQIETEVRALDKLSR